jgi:hypothetical protein
VKMLLDHRADISAQDNDWHTAHGLASVPRSNPAENIIELLRIKDVQNNQ